MDLNLQQVLTLVHLLLIDAHRNYVELTTTELSKSIGKSQQSASKYLLELENLGYIDRLRSGHSIRVKITDRGYSQVRNFYDELRSAIEPKSVDILRLEGQIVSGMGEGAYYMSLEGYRKQFRVKLGYSPFPGTLNIKLSDPISMSSRRDLSAYPSIFIDGFSDELRTYGWVKCYPVELNNGLVENAAIVILERTHHDDSTIEIIAPISIKDNVKLKNGDHIAITARIQNYTRSGTVK